MERDIEDDEEKLSSSDESEQSLKNLKDKVKALRSPQQDLLIDEYKRQFANDNSDKASSQRRQSTSSSGSDESEKVAISRSPEHDLLIEQYRQQYEEQPGDDEILHKQRELQYEVFKAQGAYRTEEPNFEFDDNAGRFQELEFTEDRWDNEPEPDYLTSYEKKNRQEWFDYQYGGPYSERTSSRDDTLKRRIDYKESVPVPPSRQVVVTTRTPTGVHLEPFEPVPKHEIELRETAPNIQNIKMRFEELNRKKAPQRGSHPPEIEIDFGHGAFPEYGPLSDDEDERRHHKGDMHYVKEIPVPKEEEFVMIEEQRPVSEIMSKFGGKATSPRETARETKKFDQSDFTTQRIIRATDRYQQKQPVVIPEKSYKGGFEERRRSSVTSDRSGSDKVTELPVIGQPHRPPHHDDSRFSSVRVVKNVREYVRGYEPHLKNEQPIYLKQAYREPYVQQPQPKDSNIQQHRLSDSYKPQQRDSYIHQTEPKDIRQPHKMAHSPKETYHLKETPFRHEPEKKEVAVQAFYDEHKEEQDEPIIVSERKLIFETKKPKHRHTSSKAINVPKPQSFPERTPQLEIKVPRDEERAVISVKEQTFTTNEEIEQAAQEISDYIAQITPVSQRKLMFERRH